MLRQPPDSETEQGLSIAEFERAVLREKARVERNGRHFSLLVFAPRGSVEEPVEPIECLLPILLRRVRLSDVVGRLDAGQVAVILPETNGDEAWALADSIATLLTQAGLAFDCSVHAFPFGNGPAEGASHRDDDSSKGNGSASGNGAAHHGGNGKPGAVAEGSSSVATKTSRARNMHLRSDPSRPGRPPVVRNRPVGDLSLAFLLPLPWWKRTMDVLLAALLLALTLPVSLLTAIAIRLTSPGPILFRQVRVGRAGRTFTFLKFRTMEVGAEACQDGLRPWNDQPGPAFKLKNDPRVTTIGKFLRRTSIDEIPQLWNVLRGDMAIVGPRPPTPDEVRHYEVWQLQRLSLTGGLTGSWQVSGRSLIGFVDWVRMDIRYARQRGFWRDLLLLAKTPWAVLSRRGAF